MRKQDRARRIDLDAPGSAGSGAGPGAGPAAGAARPWPALSISAYDAALSSVGATALDQRPAYRGLQVTMHEVCVLGGFALGHAYLTLPSSGQLLPAHLWEIASPARFAPFVRATTATVLAPGVGLPGQAAATRQPAFLAVIDDEGHLPRARAARAVGLRSAAAFPVLDEERVVAVLEFLDVAPRQADAGALRALAGLVDVLAPMLRGADAEDLLRHELAMAEAADLLRRGSVPIG